MYDTLSRADYFCDFSNISGGNYKSADVAAVRDAWLNIREDQISFKDSKVTVNGIDFTEWMKVVAYEWKQERKDKFGLAIASMSKTLVGHTPTIKPSRKATKDLKGTANLCAVEHDQENC